MTLPTAENLLQFSAFLARRQGVDLPWDRSAVESALEHASTLVATGEPEEVALFYGLAKEECRIGPVAIHLALALIACSLQQRRRRFGGVTKDEMRRPFLAVGSGEMSLADLRVWIEERTTLA